MNSMDWLKKLISFNTVSSHSNLELITTIRDWLNSHHIESTLTFDESQQKANLLAILPDKNGNIQNGIILSGHTDVVPVEGQSWDTDPFTAIIKTDKLYGRGASDMKGFIAVILALIPEFITSSRNTPLYLCFSYDEEVGCLGAPKLISEIQQKNISPAICIVGEPTNMNLVVAHKGIHVFRCRIHGVAAHSSLTNQGCNAIEYAAELIQWIKKYSLELKNKDQDTCYDVAYTTISTNMISGGNALNIVPDFCEFYFEFRNLPTANPSHIINHIKRYAENDFTKHIQQSHSTAHVTIESLVSVPAHEVSEEDTMTKQIRELMNDFSIRKVSYTTEAGLFQKANIPTFICGPGSIEQAHRANEYIELEQLSKCENFLKKLITIS